MARLAVYGTYCWTCLRSVRLHTAASLERSAAKACSRGCAVNCERKLSMSPNTRSRRVRQAAMRLPLFPFDLRTSDLKVDLDLLRRCILRVPNLDASLQFAGAASRQRCDQQGSTVPSRTAAIAELDAPVRGKPTEGSPFALACIATLALRSSSPAIEIGRTPADFMRLIGLADTQGRSDKGWSDGRSTHSNLVGLARWRPLLQAAWRHER